MPNSRSRGLALATALLVLCTNATTDAHRRDEYLQASRLALDPTGVQIELDLTPGIDIAAQVLPDIDLDGNGSIDAAEGRTYAERARRAVTLDVDGLALTIQLVESRFPAVVSMRRGEGRIRIRLAASIDGLVAGSHRLHYRNTHRPDVGVYLANVLVPADDHVKVTGQQRDVDQRDLVIDYELRGSARPRVRVWLVAGLAGALLGAGIRWWRSSRQPPDR